MDMIKFAKDICMNKAVKDYEDNQKWAEEKKQKFVAIIKDNKITIMTNEGDFVECYECEEVILK